MVAPHPEPTEAATLTQDAWDYCITPLLPVDEIRAGGLHIYKSGEGVRLTDYEGNTWLDMMSSHTRANSLGYGNAEIARAVADQLRRSTTSARSPTSPSRPSVSPRDRRAGPGRALAVMFVSGGSEAVETALKIAKQYQASGNKPRAYKIISRWNAYHGATMGALSVDRLAGHARTISEPTVPGLPFVPGPTATAIPFGMDGRGIRRALRHRPRAADPARGTGAGRRVHRRANHAGARRADRAAQLLPRVREICDKYGVL